MTTLPLLLSLPWLGLILVEAFVMRLPSELPAADGDGGGADGGARDGPTQPDPEVTGADGPEEDRHPLVSVIVPARDEERSIVDCLTSIASSTYPEFEIVVVDDRSGDRTAELAWSVAPGNARRLEVVAGRPLPDGWLGKPWACHQGAQAAEGELLLFTDADTVHGPELLGRALAGLREEDADLLTVMGRQILGSFWERLVQPHVFFLMLMRFPDFERIAPNDNWRDAVANGQFLLFTREAYQAIAGHEAVKDEVVEDLALAQVVKRSGLELRIRSAEESLATRMYRSLSEIVAGWSKNMIMGGLQSVPAAVRPVLPPVSFVGGFVLWLLAPCILSAALVGLLDPASAPGDELVVWAFTVYALSVVLWMRVYHWMGAGWWYGPLYPVAAAVFSWIFLRSWVRGRNVEWKGRRYELRAVSERP